MQRVPQIVRGGANILWGEPETSWEGYISGHPAHRQRNKGVLIESARRLGAPPDLLDTMRVRMSFAGGGIAQAGGLAASAPVAVGGPSMSDYGTLARVVAAEVSSALLGVEVRMDGDKVGRLVTRWQRGAAVGA